jgi:hypothetical protein
MPRTFDTFAMPYQGIMALAQSAATIGLVRPASRRPAIFDMVVAFSPSAVHPLAEIDRQGRHQRADARWRNDYPALLLAVSTSASASAHPHGHARNLDLDH